MSLFLLNYVPKGAPGARPKYMEMLVRPRRRCPLRPAWLAAIGGIGRLSHAGCTQPMLCPRR